MKVTSIIYRYRTKDVCVSLSFATLFLQISRNVRTGLRMAHGGDEEAMFREAVEMAGIGAEWMGDRGAILKMGDVEIPVTPEQCRDFSRCQVKIAMPPEVRWRMAALLELQERWEAGYDDTVKMWIFDTVLCAWDAPLLARQVIQVWKSGIEPFSLLQWREFHHLPQHCHISVLWCGFYVRVWTGWKKKQRKEGPWIWTSKKRKDSATRRNIKKRLKSLAGI